MAATLATAVLLLARSLFVDQPASPSDQQRHSRPSSCARCKSASRCRSARAPHRASRVRSLHVSHVCWCVRCACMFVLQSGFVSFVCVLVSCDGPLDIVRRDSSHVRLSSFLVSDHTARSLQVKVWGELTMQAPVVDFRVGQVILFHDVEMSSFRGVASASSKARSRMHIMEKTREERSSGAHADTDRGDPTMSAEKRQRTDFRTARNHPIQSPSKVPQLTAANVSNWVDVSTAACTLLTWAQHLDGHAMLYEAIAARAQPTPNRPATSDTPFTLQQPPQPPAALNHSSRLANLAIGQLVDVSAQLRCVRRMASTAAATAFSHSIFCVLSERDDSGAALLVELELRSTSWWSSERQRFWHHALGSHVRLTNVRAQWSARADGIILVDTEHTGETHTRRRRVRATLLLLVLIVCVMLISASSYFTCFLSFVRDSFSTSSNRHSRCVRSGAQRRVGRPPLPAAHGRSAYSASSLFAGSRPLIRCSDHCFVVSFFSASVLPSLSLFTPLLLCVYALQCCPRTRLRRRVRVWRMFQPHASIAAPGRR